MWLKKNSVARSSKTRQFKDFRDITIWAKKVEIKADEILLDQTRKGITAFQLAARKNQGKGMWVWAEET